MHRHLLLFEIKDSNIKGAGRGVFYKGDAPIGRGEFLFEYEGILLGEGGKERSFRSDRSIDISEGYEIFGTGIASFINDGLDEFPSNCAFVSVGNGKDTRVYVFSTCRIYQGDELFVKYGGDFWKVHGT